MLAMQLDVQQKVFDEIHELDTSAPITMEGLRAYTFLEQVIKESLRLFPVFPLAGRKPMSDVNIGPCVVTPDVSVLIDLFSLHRRKDIWGANADTFDPTRFAPDQMEGKHPYCFIPFSAGPRNCIGSRYAMLKIKVILIHLLKSYKFTTDLKFDDLKLNYMVSLRLHNRHLVKISRR
jgi:cytochrome P450